MMPQSSTMPKFENLGQLPHPNTARFLLPFPLDVALIDLIPGKELHQAVPITDQHQFLEFPPDRLLVSVYTLHQDFPQYTIALPQSPASFCLIKIRSGRPYPAKCGGWQDSHRVCSSTAPCSRLAAVCSRALTTASGEPDCSPSRAAVWPLAL